jgi:hypothetical protein
MVVEPARSVQVVLCALAADGKAIAAAAEAVLSNAILVIRAVT